MLQPSTSVSGPQELVTQVFSVLLEYLVSPESSSMVHAQGAGWRVEGRGGGGRQRQGTPAGLSGARIVSFFFLNN